MATNKQEEWQFLQVIFYGLACLLRKTKDFQFASNADLFMLAV